MKKPLSLVWMVLAPFILAGIFAGCSRSAPRSSAGSAGEVVTIDVWGWETEQLQATTFEKFNRAFPNIKVTMTLTESADMSQRVQTALASGSKMPDIAWLEINQRGKLLALDCWADLAKSPFNVNKADLIGYMLPLSANARGELVGIDDAPSMAGFAYKRELAQEYFGVSEPEDLEALFTSWDVILEKGVKVKRKSNGKVFMFTGPGDVMNILKGQNNVPFAENGALNLRKAIGEPLDTILKFKEAGIIDTIEQGTPAWNASMADTAHIFYPAAHWSPQWIIKPNDPDANNTWGIMVPPGGGFPYGGTCWSIAKNAEHPKEAWDYLNWFLLTNDGAVHRRDDRGYYSALASLYSDSSFYTAVDERFGGQDISRYFTQKILPAVTPSRQVFQYDLEVADALNLALKTINSSGGGLTSERLIASMEQDILGKIPDLKAEK
ncbi:MAG: extracellular solute-binding protein [Treponema sp.]|jgi:multiple sugar transport system substrate-binding protein|nr:extracellular solute-binding protein [Treponema sp.]